MNPSTLHASPTRELPGLLRGLEARGQQVRGCLETLALARVRPLAGQALAPLEALELAGVRTYGHVRLRNRDAAAPLVAPMHVGFVQGGAQNHATAQAHVLAPGETLDVTDAFCIQQRQGGFLGAAQQRFLMLPQPLRHRALALRDEESFGRLWADIEVFTRRFGIARGGHLDKLWRPYFGRLLRTRHAVEAEPGQVGAAWFVGDRLVGVEVLPDPGQLRELLGVLAIYAYGPAAALWELEHEPPALPRRLDLLGVTDLDELAARLAESRAVDRRSRLEPLRELAAGPWELLGERLTHGLRQTTLRQGPWLGQAVRQGEDLVYLSLAREADREA